ncbi:MAG TPA: PDZ domain-containing protein [Gemmataceae bacterium]|jgi:membrane-associated protease RseP (regulator of RpoE activity)
MYKLLLPTGMIALLLSALTLAAQTPPDTTRTAPKQPPATTPQKTAPDRGAIQTDKPPSKSDAKSDKQTRRRRHNRVYLGVCTIPVEDMSNRMRRKLKLKDTDGVIVVEVMPDSPAEEAGLKHGDIITHVNGKLIEDEDELCDDLNQLGPGKTVKLDVCRDGKKQEIKAELDESPAQEFAPPHSGLEPGFQERFSGRERELLERIDHLERRLYHLENHLQDLERNRSARGQ